MTMADPRAVPTQAPPLPRVLAFEDATFPLRGLVQEAIGRSDLELLHRHNPEDLQPASAFKCTPESRTEQRRVQLLQHALDGLWKSSDQRKLFLTHYLPLLIATVIAPTMPEETEFVFQKAPMLRFHIAWPEEEGGAGEGGEGVDGSAAVEQADVGGSAGQGQGQAGGRVKPTEQAQRKKRAKPAGTLTTVHTDGDYGHPAAEINYWLPVSLRTWGANSMMVESAPGKGDFAPFELAYGQFMQWYGNTNRHFSHRNTTAHTRLSIDFRVIPGSLAGQCDLTTGKYKLGQYYDTVQVPRAGSGIAPGCRAEDGASS